MKHVYVFTTNGCPFCDGLKKMLIEERISFFPLDIEMHEKEFLPVIEESGLDYVPAIRINCLKTGKMKYIIPERDFKHLNACVQLIKNELNTKTID